MGCRDPHQTARSQVLFSVGVRFPRTSKRKFQSVSSRCYSWPQLWKPLIQKERPCSLVRNWGHLWPPHCTNQLQLVQTLPLFFLSSVTVEGRLSQEPVQSGWRSVSYEHRPGEPPTQEGLLPSTWCLHSHWWPLWLFCPWCRNSGPAISSGGQYLGPPGSVGRMVVW